MGSSVVGVGGEILYWASPIYLMDVGCVGGLVSWGVFVAGGPSLSCGGSRFLLFLWIHIRGSLPVVGGTARVLVEGGCCGGGSFLD